MEIKKIIMFTMVLISLNVLKLRALPINLSFNIFDKVYITQQNEGEFSQLGDVNGVRSCGGHGQLIQLRYESCPFTDFSSDNCHVPGDGGVRRFELEFIPSRDVAALGFQFLVLSDGHITTAYEQQIQNSTVFGGQKYTVNVLAGANSQLKDKTVTIQYMIFRMEDDNLEACAEANINVI